MKSLLSLLVSVLLSGVAWANVAEPSKGEWVEGVSEVKIVSDRDGAEQPALFLPAKGDQPRPLVLFLHQWRGDYRYTGGRPIARWCQANNWTFVQPDFRGPNVRPEAMGSELVISDLRSAVAYAKEHAPVDADRIFVIGASGGGHAALLAAARMPGVFRGASVWVPISDLKAWYAECEGTAKDGYAKDIAKACGGPLTPGSEAEREAEKRSPLTYLSPDSATLFDINAGIHDGHGKLAVPVSHAFRAYNAAVPADDRVAEDVIASVTQMATIPEDLKFQGSDGVYKNKPVLFRKESQKARLSVFDGGHEMVPSAALAWVEKVSRAEP